MADGRWEMADGRWLGTEELLGLGATGARCGVGLGQDEEYQLLGRLAGAA